MSRKGLNIYKRKDGRWEARYIKSRTAQGKPLYGYLYASSYHEARNRLQDVIRLQGNAPNSKEMSKGSVFEFFSIEWLDTFSTSFKESTYIRYRTLIRCYLMPYFQTAKIESITKEHVLDFCKEIETHGKRDGTALSTKTVSDILSVLRRILHYAKAQNIPVDSAIFDIRIKQTPKPLPVLSLSEQLTLQKYLIGHPDCLNLGILLCLFTGIRIGELCALTWDKISLSERNLCICQTMQRMQQMPMFSMDSAVGKKMISASAILHPENGGRFVEYWARLYWARTLSMSLLVLALAFCAAVFMDGYMLFAVLVAGVAMVAVIYSNGANEMSNQLQKRSTECMMEFSNVVSKLTLLMNCGMILKEAWYIVAKSKQGIIYELMQEACREMDNGMASAEAIYNFGVRTGSPEVRKFASIIML